MIFTISRPSENFTSPDADTRDILLPTKYIYEAGRSAGCCVSIFMTYSTSLARSTLSIKDLFVLPDHRGQGFGDWDLELILKCVTTEQFEPIGIIRKRSLIMEIISRIRAELTLTITIILTQQMMMRRI